MAPRPLHLLAQNTPERDRHRVGLTLQKGAVVDQQTIGIGREVDRHPFLRLGEPLLDARLLAQLLLESLAGRVLAFRIDFLLDLG